MLKQSWITQTDYTMQTKKHSILNTMKNGLFITLIAGLLMACGGSNDALTELDVLKGKRDSLKLAKDDLSSQIAELEKIIGSKDTTKSLAIVTARRVQTADFKHYFEVYGTVETDQNAQIYSELGGKITSINVNEGDRVSQGQSIAVVDASVLREQEGELKTRLELAETTYQKQKRLWDQKIGSEMQFLQAKNNRDALKNSLETIQAQIAMTNIKAPFNGIVDEVYPKPGEMAMPGQPIIRLINLSNVYVKADISENFLGKVKQGDFVNIKFPSIGVDKKSIIDRTGQYINPANRTFKIKTSIANEDNLLKPNMVALLEIQDFAKDSGIVIPSSMILQGAGGKDYVYVIESNNGVNTLKKTDITVERTYKGTSLISEGLSGKELLVEKGARSVRNGQQVNVKEN